MRLVHVMQRYWPAQGGAERYWQEISERAAGEGHAVEVYTTNALDIVLFWEPGRAFVPTPVETHNGVEIHRFPVRQLIPHPVGYRAIRRLIAEASDLNAPIPLLKRLARFAPYSPDLARALHDRSAPVDLITGVNIVYEGLLFAALESAQARRIPFVFCPLAHLGEPGNRSLSRFYTMRHQIWLAASSSAVLANARGEAEYFARRGVPKERIVVTGPGITPERTRGGDARRGRERFKLEGPVVLFIGTLSNDKGARQAVEAIAKLAERGQDATLVLAGTPLDEFRRFLNAVPARVQSRCRVLGPVSEEDKQDLLAACDMLVLPSRVDSFGIVLLEAWLYDKPVIGARAGGIPDVIDHECNGLLVPFGDANALAEAICHLLAHPDLRAAYGTQGKAKVYERYTSDRVYEWVSKVYRRLVNGESIADLSWANVG